MTTEPIRDATYWAVDQVGTLRRQLLKLRTDLGNSWDTIFMNVTHRLRMPRGTDASKESSPKTGAIYQATDTKIIYACFTDGTWTAISGRRTIVFVIAGTLAVSANASFEIPAPYALAVYEVQIHVKTAPTGAALTVDVNKGGTTIFTTQGNRPSIAAGGTDDTSGTPDVTALAEGNVISVDIDQVGSTIAGADLTVSVRCRET